MLTLYGSVTSPYVRRLRILMEGKDFEFSNIHLFNPEDRKMLTEKNPTLKIPMLQDGDAVIYDSRVIFRYLSDKLDLPAITWEQENLLTVIDSANDSFVQMFILSNSEFDTSDDRLYFNLQRERIGVVFKTLEAEVQKGTFDNWDYPAICLYCMLDWVTFRNLYDYSEYEALNKFYAANSDRSIVKETIPHD